MFVFICLATAGRMMGCHIDSAWPLGWRGYHHTVSPLFLVSCPGRFLPRYCPVIEIYVYIHACVHTFAHLHVWVSMSVCVYKVVHWERWVAVSTSLSWLVAPWIVIMTTYCATGCGGVVGLSALCFSLHGRPWCPCILLSYLCQVLFKIHLVYRKHHFNELWSLRSFIYYH